MDRVKELEEEVRQLRAEFEAMRRKLDSSNGSGTSAAENESKSTNRRNFLRLGAGAALGAAGLAATKILPASAATGGNFILGNANLAENPTTIQGDGVSGAPVPVLASESNGFVPGDLTATGETLIGPLQGLGISGGTIPASAVNADGVDGWAGGIKAFGVYGLTDAGVGTVGESGTGVSLYARGSGRILQDPHNLSGGVPDYTPNQHEMVRDANGAMWISGPGGTWMRPSLNVFPNPRRIVDGFAHPMTSGLTYGPFDATKESDLVTPTGIPVGAQAAWCAVQSYKPGVLTIYPDGAPNPNIANFSATGTLTTSFFMLYMLIPLSAAAKFKVAAYISGVVVIDAWGFLI